MKKGIKKGLGLSLAVIAGLSLAACRSKGDNDKDNDGPSTPEVQTYKIIFVTSHGETPTEVSDVSAIPTLPTLTYEGYTFEGWYTDSSYTNKAVEGTDITSNITLYAKWAVTPIDGNGTEDGDGSEDAGTGDGSGDAGTGDGSGDAGTGDGSGDAGTGDGSGDAGTGDGSGDAGTGDGSGDNEEENAGNLIFSEDFSNIDVTTIPVSGITDGTGTYVDVVDGKLVVSGCDSNNKPLAKIDFNNQISEGVFNINFDISVGTDSTNWGAFEILDNNGSKLLDLRCENSKVLGFRINGSKVITSINNFAFNANTNYTFKVVFDYTGESSTLSVYVLVNEEYVKVLDATDFVGDAVSAIRFGNGNKVEKSVTVDNIMVYYIAETLTQTQTKYKSKLLTEFNKYDSTKYTYNYNNILNIYNACVTAIDSATDKENIKSLYEEALTNMAAVKNDVKFLFEKAVSEANEELAEYKASDYTKNSESFEEVMSTVTNAIENATTTADIDTAMENFYIAMDEIQSDAEILEEAKETAVDEIDEYADSDDYTLNASVFETIYNTALDAIETATTTEILESIVEAFKSAIDELKLDEDIIQDLRETVYTSITGMNDYELEFSDELIVSGSGLYRVDDILAIDTTDSELEAIYNQIVEKFENLQSRLDNLVTYADVEAFATTFKNEIDKLISSVNASVEELIETNIAHLEEYAESKSYDLELDSLKSYISSQTNKADINLAYQECCHKIDIYAYYKAAISIGDLLVDNDDATSEYIDFINEVIDTYISDKTFNNYLLNTDDSTTDKPKYDLDGSIELIDELANEIDNKVITMLDVYDLAMAAIDEINGESDKAISVKNTIIEILYSEDTIDSYLSATEDDYDDLCASAEEFFAELIEELEDTEFTITLVDGTSASVSVKYGNTAELPEQTSDDKLFLGWYLDAEFNEEFDAEEELYDNLTLYAKWSDEFYTVTFVSEHGITPSVFKGFSLDELPILTDSDYKFLGWYYDEAYESAVVVGEELTGNISIYAKWVAYTQYEKLVNKDGLVYSNDFESYSSTDVVPTWDTTWGNKGIYQYVNIKNASYVSKNEITVGTGNATMIDTGNNGTQFIVDAGKTLTTGVVEIYTELTITSVGTGWTFLQLYGSSDVKSNNEVFGIRNENNKKGNLCYRLDGGTGTSLNMSSAIAKNDVLNIYVSIDLETGILSLTINGTKFNDISTTISEFIGFKIVSSDNESSTCDIDNIAIVHTEKDLDVVKSIYQSKLDTYYNSLNKELYSINKETLDSIYNTSSAAIQNLTTCENVYAAYKDALVQLAEVQTDLQIAQVAAVTELESYKVASDYTINSETLTASITDGKTAINAALTVDDVNSALAAAKTAIDAIESDLQIATAKTTALETLDGVDATKYTLNEEAFNKVISDYKAIIEAATSIKDIEEALTKALDEINNIETNDVVIAKAKTTAIDDLNKYVDANDYTLSSTELSTAISNGTEAINACDSLDDIDAALTAAKTAIDAIDTDAELTQKARETVYSSLTGITNYNTEFSTDLIVTDGAVYGSNSILALDTTNDEVKAVYDQIIAKFNGLKTRLDSLSTKAEVEALEATFKAEIDALIATTSQTLEDVQAQAISNLAAYCESVEYTKDITALNDKINAATAKSEVSTIYDDCVNYIIIDMYVDSISSAIKSSYDEITKDSYSEAYATYASSLAIDLMDTDNLAACVITDDDGKYNVDSSKANLDTYKSLCDDKLDAIKNIYTYAQEKITTIIGESEAAVTAKTSIETSIVEDTLKESIKDATTETLDGVVSNVKNTIDGYITTLENTKFTITITDGSTESVEVLYGCTPNIPEQNKSEFKFGGFFIDAEFNTEYIAGATYDNVTIYVKWNAAVIVTDTFTIQEMVKDTDYSSNSGYFSVKSNKTVSYLDTVNAMQNGGNKGTVTITALKDLVLEIVVASGDSKGANTKSSTYTLGGTGYYYDGNDYVTISSQTVSTTKDTTTTIKLKITEGDSVTLYSEVRIGIYSITASVTL